MAKPMTWILLGVLLGIARQHPQPRVRKEAIFWLGQSGDPKALDLFEEILLK